MFLFIVLFLILFELLGSVFVNKLRMRPLKFYAPIGFMVFLAAFYVIMMPILFFKLPNIMVLIVGVTLLLIAIFMIVINRDKVKIKFSWEYLLVILFVFVFVYKTANVTLGAAKGFDSSFYLTYVAGIVSGDNLNALDITYGLPNGSVDPAYYFQAFFHFNAFIVMLESLFFKHLIIAPVYMWTASIFFFTFSIETIINFVNYLLPKKRYWYYPPAILFAGFYYGSFYWNNAFAFFGNTYRGLMAAYAIYYVYLYLNRKKNAKYGMLISFLSLTAVSSTGSYFVVMIAYSLVFTAYRSRKYLVKDLVMVSFFPLLNLVFITFGVRISPVLLLAIIFLIAAYFLNDFILNTCKRVNWPLAVIILVIIALAGLSYKITGLSLRPFFDSGSTSVDMTVDYTHLGDLFPAFIALTYLITIIYLVSSWKKPLTRFYLVMILTFLSPLTVGVISHYMVVYYRSWELVFNVFTFTLFICSFAFIKQEYLNKGLIIAFSVTSLVFGINLYSSIYHISFETSDDYNSYYRMNNDEVEVVKYFNEIFKENDTDTSQIRIIFDDLVFRNQFPYAYNIFNRMNAYRSNGDDIELYDVFKLYQSYDDIKYYSENDYMHMTEMALEYNYDYIVEDKRINLYKESGDYYVERYHYVEASGAKILLDNDSYAVYEVRNYE